MLMKVKDSSSCRTFSSCSIIVLSFRRDFLTASVNSWSSRAPSNTDCCCCSCRTSEEEESEHSVCPEGRVGGQAMRFWPAGRAQCWTLWTEGRPRRWADQTAVRSFPQRESALCTTESSLIPEERDYCPQRWPSPPSEPRGRTNWVQ